MTYKVKQRNTPKSRKVFLSYGGGVNSTALAAFILSGEMLEYDLAGIIFADTKTERPETYDYIDNVFKPYLRQQGHELITVADKEGVLERWERLSVTGSRQLRTCTIEAKIKPIDTHIKANGNYPTLIAIDAGESHRARQPRDGRELLFPLVERDIDREDCKQIIQAAGLCVPVKSGCWCCPFLRVGEIIELCEKYPDRADRIRRLEDAANCKHPGHRRTQFGEKPMSYWIARASADSAQGRLFSEEEFDDTMPCRCWAD